MRVSARLDESRSQKLEFLCDSQHLGTTEVLKRAIDLYFEQCRATRPAEVFHRMGFVGSGEADPELSTHYKEELTRSLSAKHDHR